MTLSIIIPIFRVEKYIADCLNSILPQIQGKEIEMILIDDGTPDRSADIAEAIINGHSNIRLYHQSNEGLSCARNYGLNKAIGEYVWFIDSDDTIVENTISGIIDTLKSESPDLLQLNYQKIFENGNSPVKCTSNFTGSSTGKIITAKGGLEAPAQFTIFRRLFLIENSLIFKPKILHEDSEFKPRTTYLANKICFYQPIVYNYLQRDSGSIMNSFKFRNANDVVVGINSLINFYREHIQEEECLVGFRRNIGMNFNNIIHGICKMDDKDRVETFKLLKGNKHILKDMMKSRSLKYVSEGFFFYVNIELGYKLYSLIKK